MERRTAQWIRTGIVAIGALLLAGSLPAQNNAPPAPSMSPSQLDSLVSPIALYPDPLLGQVLAASTYPVELVEAQQWLKTVGNLNGQGLMDAARQQDWDPSVQALVAMPDVMNLLTQDIRWTTDLGNAFLAQQSDVMSAVQRMRQRAQANGQLQSNQQETVTTNNDNGQSDIAIQPADPNMMYVPAYDPYYVYGYGNYPPLYYPDGYWFQPGINMGFYFGGWGGWGFGGWGWSPNWFGRSIYVNRGFFGRYGYHYNGFGGRNGNIWAHDPGHRLGAGYPGGQVSNRYGAASQAARINAGRSGNWHSFNGNNSGYAGRTNSFRGGERGGENSAQRFQSTPRQSNGGQYRGGNNFRSAPQQQQHYQQSAPRQNFQSAPQQRMQSAPRMTAPSAPRGNFSGGGARSFGGGGGSFHGGGGGGSHSGGGGHGGHR